ncbi:MAG: putative teichuronic acid biosynthesis glycosyltransferase TuaG [Firmicutes bacterium ADurb.Bin300]|nr:MAG: putative teichuronic acid biosynthesis glycosyltransferase TuaG [Firmicutes bacterium ADurb.Bin300]
MESEGNLKISVVMPAYNAESFIEDAVNSVLAQTFEDYELIIIDDCSGDNTYEMIEGFARKDSRIRVYRNEKNSGVSFTRNFGISVARYKWIAFLDSDDMWRPKKLEKQLELLKEHPNAIITYTGSSFIDFEGTPFSYNLPAVPVITYKELLKHNLLSCSSVMVKKDVIKRIKMAHDKMHEDYSAWLQILREYEYAFGINEPLLVYRISKNSKSANRIKSARMIYNSYRYVGYNFIIAALLMLRYSIYSIKKRRLIKRGE